MLSDTRHTKIAKKYALTVESAGVQQVKIPSSPQANYAITKGPKFRGTCRVVAPRAVRRIDIRILAAFPNFYVLALTCCSAQEGKAGVASQTLAKYIMAGTWAWCHCCGVQRTVD